MKVYVAHTLTKENDDYVKEVTREFTKLDSSIEFLYPPMEQDKKYKDFYVNWDVELIDRADEVWVIGLYGHGTSWEMGYAQAKGKKVYMFESYLNRHLISSDWMSHFRGIVTTETLMLNKFKEQTSKILKLCAGW